MNKRCGLLLGCFLLLFLSDIPGWETDECFDSLASEISRYCADKRAEVGVSVVNLRNDESVRINNDTHYPLQSVAKFPIVLTVLKDVDRGLLSLDQKVAVDSSNMKPGTWSPLREAFLDGRTDFSLADIIQFTMAQSDNNGCDILLALTGGTGKVERYLQQIGITNMQIRASEYEMHRNPELQYENWSTPEASTELLSLFYNRKLLEQETHDFLWDVMIGTTTGAGRIKGNLPQTAQVAHKTGTSAPPGESGITVSINDMGIVCLPDKGDFAICVYVFNSEEDYSTNEKIIADISEMAWNFFLQ